MELIGRITGRSVRGLNADAALDSDLGLSSLDRVELISALEDRYQVDLSETRFSAARTVGDVERMLSGEARPRAEYHYPRWVLRWPVTWVRWLAHYLLMRPAMILLGWPRIEGRENLRGWSGPLLVVCNHIADVDVAFRADGAAGAAAKPHRDRDSEEKPWRRCTRRRRAEVFSEESTIGRSGCWEFRC